MGMDSPKELDKYVNRITLDSSRYERPVEGLLNLLLEKHPQAAELRAIIDENVSWFSLVSTAREGTIQAI